MQTTLARLYEHLMAELSQIRGEGIVDEVAAEEGFTCCTRHWETVKEAIRSVDFRDEDEEIRFFKYEKPRFTGLIEYFILVYQALVFVPNDFEEQSGFWQREMRRADKFHAEHNTFYTYYYSGATFEDHTWFMRVFEEDGIPLKDRIYCRDTRTTAPMDWLVAMAEGYRRYREFLQKKV